MDAEAAIRERYEALAPLLNERTRRCWAAAEARVQGYGGLSLVSQATGIGRHSISRGLRELPTLGRASEDARTRIRREGGGRKSVVTHDPALIEALDRLIEPATRGAPDSPLRWTCKGTARLANELRREHHEVSARTVAALLRSQNFSLQAPVKSREGGSPAIRDAQFEYIAQKVGAFQSLGWPVISVDSKKKELVGNFRTSGIEWQPSGHPVEVNIHDFPTQAIGQARPYGVYDLTANLGWVNVGTDHDTPRFAVQSIRAWWNRTGRRMYPKATRLLITADSGGSNSSHSRVWKADLQKLATETGVGIAVCHFPRGTSKWNKIEHRLFCHITENWRGRPLTSYETIVQLIAHTTTAKGLQVEATLDHGQYPLGERVSKERFAALRLEKDDFNGDSNYWLMPD